jgi:hypothetical protein
VLRERIALAIDSEIRGRPRRRRILVAALAVAAVAVVTVVLLAVPSEPTGVERAHRTTEALVADHLEYAHRNDRLQVASMSRSEVERWFESEVQLAVRLPELDGARLLGGRHCQVAGRSAALAFYDRGGEPVSVFVFPSRGEDWSDMHEIAGRSGKRTCRHHDRGVGLLVWEERGLIYAVASALDAPELEGLVPPR